MCSLSLGVPGRLEAWEPDREPENAPECRLGQPEKDDGTGWAEANPWTYLLPSLAGFASLPGACAGRSGSVAIPVQISHDLRIHKRTGGAQDQATLDQRPNGRA